jgi:hypothetical protein
MYHFKIFKNMTKRFIFSVAAIAIMMVSCSQNEMQEVYVPSSDAITLDPSTLATRASIANLQTLQGDDDGFAVYAENGAPAIGWHAAIGGSNNHFYNVGTKKWNFKNPVQWPTEPTDYPMTFIAYYPTAPNKVITEVKAVFPDVLLDIEIPVKSSEQLDVLAGEKGTNSKPATATISMGFHHVLSKVHFSVTNIYKGDKTNTQNAYVLAVGFCNLHTNNVYDIRKTEWSTPITDDLDNYSYYNDFVGLTGNEKYTEMLFKGADRGKFNSSAFVFANSFMMLLPQNPVKWDTSDPEAVEDPTDTKEAYVKMLYRVEETAAPENLNFIGFHKASDHPNYDNSELAKTGYDGPLYVLVGYSYEPAWISGKGYEYNIPIPGSTGGRLLDKNYYDDQGNETDLEVEDIEVPEVIIPDDDYIHLSPIVTDWDDDDYDVLDQ